MTTSRNAAVERLATDPEFAAAFRADPSGVGAALGLSGDDVEFLRALVPDPAPGDIEQLEQRVSRSSLSFGGALSHLFGGGTDGHDAAPAHVMDEQHHSAAVATPWGPGHGPDGPNLPGSDGPWSPGHGPDGTGGLDLPHHGSQGSGTETPFHTGGPSGGGVLPTGQSGDDTPTVDVSVHHDDHHLGTDGRAGYNPATDDSNDAGDKSNLQPSTQTSVSEHGQVTQVRVDADGTRTYLATHADGSADVEVDHPDGSFDTRHADSDGTVTTTHRTWDGLIKGDVEIHGPHHQQGDGGPDGGTEGSGPAVDPAWASQQHTGPSGDPEVGQEHGGPNLDPAAASRVETGGAGTGGEGGTEESHGSPLKAGEASTEHVADNPTGYGTASYGKVDPNPVS